MSTGIGASITTLTNGTTANASDVMSSLNSLNSNGVSNDGGHIQTDGSGNVVFGGTLGVVGAADLIDASGTGTYVKARGGAIIFQSPSGTGQWRFDPNKKLGVASAGDFVDASAGTDIYIKNPGSGKIIFQNPGGTNVGRFDATSGNLTIKGSLTQNGTP